MESPSCDDLPGLYNQNPTKVRRKEDIKPIINSLLTRLGAILTNTILLPDSLWSMRFFLFYIN